MNHGQLPHASILGACLLLGLGILATAAPGTPSPPGGVTGTTTTTSILGGSGQNSTSLGHTSFHSTSSPLSHVSQANTHCIPGDGGLADRIIYTMVGLFLGMFFMMFILVLVTGCIKARTGRDCLVPGEGNDPEIPVPGNDVCLTDPRSPSPSEGEEDEILETAL